MITSIAPDPHVKLKPHNSLGRHGGGGLRAAPGSGRGPHVARTAPAHVVGAGTLSSLRCFRCSFRGFWYVLLLLCCETHTHPKSDNDTAGPPPRLPDQRCLRPLLGGAQGVGLRDKRLPQPRPDRYVAFACLAVLGCPFELKSRHHSAKPNLPIQTAAIALDRKYHTRFAMLVMAYAVTLRAHLQRTVVRALSYLQTYSGRRRYRQKSIVCSAHLQLSR